MYAVSEREICLKTEKNEIGAELVDQKHKQLTFGVTVCFNGCQTSNVWRQNTSCLAPSQNMFFLSHVHAQMQPMVYNYCNLIRYNQASIVSRYLCIQIVVVSVYIAFEDRDFLCEVFSFELFYTIARAQAVYVCLIK